MAEPRHIGYFDESVVKHEFRAKFSNTFVVLDHPRLKRQYWQIDANDDGTNVIFVNAHDHTYRVEGGFLDAKTAIMVVFPKIGWYFHPTVQQVFFIRRIPRRQWRRAPNRDNMQIGWLNPYSNIEIQEAVINADILNHTLNPINESNDKKYVIIDRKWLISPYNNRFKLIWYFDKVMAVIDTEQNRVMSLNRWASLPKELFGKVEIPKTMSLKK
jgi:hypothetical protein